jgi:predicted ATPase
MVQLHQGLTLYQATGAILARPAALASLAEAYAKMGQADQGLCMLAEALEQVDQMGGYWCAAELYRLQGELLLALPVQRPAEAETCFRQVLDVARHQQAKSRALRAAMSLSRLWQRQGKRDAARALLAPIYGWFTEGFDTADLQEAQALLEELA